MSPERQIHWTAVALGAAAALAVTFLRNPVTGVALAVGAVLSLINFAWLESGARSILAAAAGAPVNRPVVFGTARFFARFLLLLVCLCAIFISHLMPMLWVVVGLLAVPAAALGVGVRLLLAGSRAGILS